MGGSLTLVWGCQENPTECTCTRQNITATATVVGTSPAGDLSLTLSVAVSGNWNGTVTIGVSAQSGVTLPPVVSKGLTGPGTVSFAIVLLAATGYLTVTMVLPDGTQVPMPQMKLTN